MLGVGDDAALVRVRRGMELAIAGDKSVWRTLVARLSDAVLPRTFCGKGTPKRFTPKSTSTITVIGVGLSPRGNDRPGAVSAPGRSPRIR